MSPSAGGRTPPEGPGRSASAAPAPQTSRPWSLAPPAWQGAAWHRWWQLVQADRLGHAYLLVGPQGTGRRPFAEAALTLLLCAAPGVQGACGACRSCRLLTAGTHPDQHVLVPEEAGTGIRIDAIRGMAERLQRHGHFGARRGVIIDPAEAVNLQAANSLLKLLEEPPSGVLFLLIVERERRLPITLRSRCQRLTLASPAPGEAQEWLRAQGISAAAATAALALAPGRPRQALTLAAEAPALLAALRDDLAALLARRADLVAVANRWQAHPELDLLLRWLLTQVRAALRAQLLPAPQDAGPTDDILRQLCNVPAARLFAYHDELQQAATESQAGMNRQLLMERLLLRWMSGFASEPVPPGVATGLAWAANISPQEG